MDSDLLKRRSRQGALISAMGFMFVVVAIVFSVLRLSELNRMVTEKTRELARIDSVLIVRDSVITLKTQQIDGLIDEINQLTDTRIYPKAKAVQIPGIKDSQGRQVYDFTIWVSTSHATMKQIQRVSYEFSHNTFILKTRESEDASNGFLVSYRGWGCMGVVHVVIQYHDNRKESLYFKMCDELGW
ncbi:MAG: pYEATS domain-containing protein [Bacteroidota bacterium]|jgi:hypothetical protein